MSSPNTDTEKEKRRHRGPLIGMRAAVILVAVMLVGLVGWLALNGNDPVTSEEQVDGRTGAVEEAAE